MEGNDEWPEDQQEMNVEEPVVEPEVKAEEKVEPKPERKKWFTLKRVEKPKERPQNTPVEEGKLKKKIGLWKRTLEVARKPSKEEYLSSLKISTVGIALVGFIGFIIYILYHIVVSV